LSHDRFDIAGGTVTGRSHALAGRGNQDAWSVRAEGAALCAVVCDGCGSGAHSEVGAQLGARLVTAALVRRLVEGASLEAPSLWDAVRREVLDALRPAALAAGGRLADTVSELMLFTVVGIAVSGDRGVVFAAGDGIAAIDGDLCRLGPFPDNAPPYLGYGLLDLPHAPGFSTVRAFCARDVRHVLIGTDGAAALADIEDGRALRRLWEEERHFQNRDALRRTLALLNRDEARPVWEERRMERRRGLLEDDATVVVLRRRS
jgi:hypothetical protein